MPTPKTGLTPEQRRQRAKIAIHSRRGTRTPDQLAADRLAYKASRAKTVAAQAIAEAEAAEAELEAHIQRIVDSAPPMTPEVAERIRALMGGAA